MGFTSLLLSDSFEVLEEVALGDLVEDSNNGGILANGGNSIVAGKTHILDFSTLSFVDSVELCNVDLSSANVGKKLFLSIFVCFVNLNINLLLGLVVDSIESLLLNNGVVKFEAAIAALNAFNELSKAETGDLGLVIDSNSTFGVGILSASFLVSDELINQLLEAFGLVERRSGLELRDTFRSAQKWIGRLNEHSV